MFNPTLFSEILQKISNSYSSITEFSEKSEVNRTYLSKYINMKLNSPPTPKILEKISSNSNGIVSYAQLMEVCGYLDISVDINSDQIKQRTEYFFEKSDHLLSIGLTKQQLSVLQDIINMDFLSSEFQEKLDNLLSTLQPEISCEVLRFLQSLLLMIRNDAEEKSRLSNNLKKEAEDLLNKASTIEELHAIEKKYTSARKKFYMCPVYGKISAGIPNWAEECLEGYLPLDPNLMGIIDPEECFFLKVNGESMNKVIRNGAYALIRKQDIVENGEIAAILVNGFEATLKKFSKQGDLVILEPMSDDSSFTTQVYNKDTEIRILGKYIGKFEMNK